MALSQKKLYTIKDIYSLPNAQRAELIDRQIYIIWLFLTVSIKNYEKNYVEPDISVICDRHNLNDRGCSGTPSLILRERQSCFLEEGGKGTGERQISEEDKWIRPNS